MTKEEFIKKLKSDYLIEVFPFIREFNYKSFLYTELNDSGSGSYSSELEDLMFNTDIKVYSVRAFTFLDRIIEYEHFLFFAEHEADALAIDKITSEVVLIDHETIDIHELEAEDNLKIDKCSKSIQAYLECLVLAYKFAEFTELIGGINENLEKVVTKKCIETAGGREYANYWLYFFSSDLDISEL